MSTSAADPIDGGMSSPVTVAAMLDHKTLASLLVRGVRAIEAEQLRTGEIPSYRRTTDGGLSYTRTVQICTFVDDALGSFDPWDRRFESRVLDLLAHGGSDAFFATVRRIRRGIRGFLAWQEEPLGTWRFFGRGSGIDPDACTIARAASIKLGPTYGKRDLVQAQVYLSSLQRFRTRDRYFTFLGTSGRGYGALDRNGTPVSGHDVLVNALVIGYLSLLGATPQATVDFLLDCIKAGKALSGTANFPNPLTAHFILAHTWQRACLLRIDTVRTSLLPALLDRQHPDGSFGGPLSTAMALSAMLDLGYEGGELEAAKAALIRCALPNGGWAAEDFVVNGYGSPAWTTALALNTLVRYAGSVTE